MIQHIKIINRKVLTTIVVVSSLIMFSNLSFSQYDQTMYYMRGVPQSNMVNPALLPQAKIYVGIPVVSAFNLKFGHSAFSYNDIYRPSSDGTFTLDPTMAFDKMDDFNNYFSFDFNADIISFGFKVKKLYFNFNITEKASFRFRYPKDLIKFVFEGNENFIGESADFNGIGFDATHYREYGLGTSFKVNKDLRLGLRGKLLYGKTNIQTERSDISLLSDSDPNGIWGLTTKADILINSSSPFFTDSLGKMNDSIDIVEYLRNTENTGFAMDIGVNYQLNYKWSLNASIIDIGSITWSSNVNNYCIEDAEFTFDGIDLNELMDQNSNDNGEDDYLTTVVDSLKEEFGMVSKQETYKTRIPTKFYIGSQYNLTYKDKVGFLIHGDIFDGKINPAFTCSFNKSIANFMHATVSYSLLNNSYTNLGFGLGINSANLQLYLITDNILSPMYPQAHKNVSFRFGLNLIAGYKEKKAADKSLID